MESVLIKANAKLNLDLKILNKLPNGYHQIESIFQSIDLSDFLLFEKSKRNIFTGAIICRRSQNIILKAISVLEKTLNKSLPCQIHLQKVIPIAAGLGGGSANAAATLLALNKLYNLNLTKKELVNIAVKIGTDVPFFIYGGTCKIEGIGDRIKPIKKKLPKFFVVFRPHKRSSTKEMYKLHDKTGKDFLTLTKEICPEIKKLERYLKRFKIKPKLTGKGPTIFFGINNYKRVNKIVEDYKHFNGDIFICQPKSKALEICKTL